MLVLVAAAGLMTARFGEKGARTSPPLFSAPAWSQLTQSSGTAAAGQFLVAARGLRDPNFVETVVLLIDYDRNGALGLIVNRPTSRTLSEVWPDIAGLAFRPLYFGGPVFPQRLLFLLRAEKTPEGARQVIKGVFISSDELLLKRVMAEGKEQFRLYAGHAGWAPGQLDNEIARGDWHILPAERSLIFHEDPAQVWPELIQRLDVQVVRAIHSVSTAGSF